MMSRKSRHTSQLKQIEKFTDTEPETIATVNRTAIYARLSSVIVCTTQKKTVSRRS